MSEKYNDAMTALTVTDLQEILFVSRNTAYSLLKSGRIHSFKVGNTWRIPLFAVEEYVGYRRASQKNSFTV